MLGMEQQLHINQILEYIDHHLHEPLPLEKLAKISTYSPYHFQRTFKAIVGETPASYIKRQRLETAAHLLIYEKNISITEVSMRCGFTSLSYFTYSFQEHFLTNPKKWREGAYLERFPREYEDRKKSKLVSNIQKDGKQKNDYNEFNWLDLTKVKTIDFPACATVSRQSIGPYTNGIPQIWEEMYHWTNSRELLRPHTFLFGVPRNNPYITPPDKMRYDCRIEIKENDKKNSLGVAEYSFKGGKHVVYEFEEPVDYSERKKLIECYSELYSFWLPRSGYRYLDNPIELVHLEPVEGTLSVESKIKAICLAIEPN